MVEVAKAIGLTLEDLHLGVKALGDSVVAGEGPHGGDFFAPGMQGIAELSQWREAATTEFGDVAQEAVGQAAAAFLVLSFLQQQAAEALFEAVDGLQSRVLSQIIPQAGPVVQRKGYADGGV